MYEFSYWDVNIQHDLCVILYLQCNGCIRSCGHESVKCFVIDNNGYIVLSKEPNDIGVFFGEIEGSVMYKLMEQKVFRNMTIYDFQAMCKIDDEDETTSSGNVLLTVCSVFAKFQQSFESCLAFCSHGLWWRASWNGLWPKHFSIWRNSEFGPKRITTVSLIYLIHGIYEIMQQLNSQVTPLLHPQRHQPRMSPSLMKTVTNLRKWWKKHKRPSARNMCHAIKRHSYTSCSKNLTIKCNQPTAHQGRR